MLTPRDPGRLTETDTVVVGAGPIGLELAVSLKHTGVDYTHLEAGQVGQTIGWYPRQTRFFSSPERIAIAGVPLTTVDQSKATREDYLAYLRGIVQQFDLPIRTYERVVGLERLGDDPETGDPEHGGARFLVRTIHGDERHAYACRHLVLAIGDMHRPRMLHIPGEDLPHVSHYFDEPHRYFRQKLLIVGGKNSAAEAAIRCARAGARVSISYRRASFDAESIKYWLMPELRSLIKARKIDFYPETLPTAITRQAVTLRHATGEHTDVPADFVLLLTGYVQDDALWRAAGVELIEENQRPRINPETMQTSVPGLYVAGTAAAGTQHSFRLFIENCHPHVGRIVRAITGKAPPDELVNDAATAYELPES